MLRANARTTPWLNGMVFSDDATPDLLAAVVARGPDAVVVVDSAGSIVFANEMATIVLGYSNADLHQLNVDALVPAYARQRHDGHRERFAASPTTRPMGVGLALHAQRADGSLIPVEIALSNTVIGGVGYTIAALRDVTYTRQLMADVARMSHAFDATHDGVFLLDASSLAILQANEGAARLTGYERAELLGLTAADLDFEADRKSTRLNSSHLRLSRMPSSA